MSDVILLKKELINQGYVLLQSLTDLSMLALLAILCIKTKKIVCAQLRRPPLYYGKTRHIFKSTFNQDCPRFG